MASQLSGFLFPLLTRFTVSLNPDYSLGRADVKSTGTLTRIFPVTEAFFVAFLMVPQPDRQECPSHHRWGRGRGRACSALARFRVSDAASSAPTKRLAAQRRALN